MLVLLSCPSLVDMPVVYYDMSEKSDWVKHRDSLWIQQRKRVYLYWSKFLQEVELSEKFEVDWNNYDGWGGSNYIHRLIVFQSTTCY